MGDRISIPPLPTLTAAFNSISEGVVVSGPDRRILFINPAFVEMTGFTPDEAIGQTCRFLQGVETDPAAIAEIRSAVDLGRTYKGEILNYRKNGQKFWNELAIDAVRDADGAIAYYIGIQCDITSLKEAIEELRRATERHYFLLDHMLAGIVVHAADTTIVYANAMAERLLGLGHDEMLGATDTDERWRFINEDGSPLEISDYPVNRAVATRADVKNVVIGIDRGSRNRLAWLIGNAYPVLDDAGMPVEIVVSFTDVTELKQAERALRASDERLRLVLQGSNDAPWDWDLVAGQIYYSPRWWEMIGYRENELAPVVTLWRDLAHPDDREPTSRVFTAALDSGHSSYEVEFRLQHRDGHYVPVLSRGFILRDEHGKAVRVSGTNTDLTERKLSERKLFETQKMAAIGTLAGGIAHDFNNLLSIICGNLELIGEGSQSEPIVAQLMLSALRAAQQGAGLTSRLLTYSRQQQLASHSVDLSELIPSMIGMLRRVVESKIEIEVTIPSDLGSVQIDAQQLEVALVNLVVNARDAMPQGGMIRIVAANAWLDEDYCRRRTDASPGDYVLIAVMDTGTGMTRQVRDRVFEPFFTTKEPGKGTGLGLSMVYGFVRQSGGHIDILSDLDTGTTVQIYLPRTPVVPEVVTIEPVVAAPDIPAGTVILVVEDDDDVRQTHILRLARLGCQTLEASSGAEGLAWVNSDSVIDLVLSDIELVGGMSGLEFMEAARLIRPGLKAVFVSGYPPESLKDYRGLADVKVMMKPFTRAALVDALREAIGRG